MLRSLFLCLLAVSCLAFADSARAEKRVALIIGISNYQKVPQLNNPTHDADVISALLKKAGFDVVDEERDLGIADLRRVIRQFSESSRDADIAVVYYAGHGIEVDGSNYLVAADARLSSDFDVEDETVSLDRVLRSLDPVKRLRLVILDACRENPFANNMKRNSARRSIGRGLARIEPTAPNTLVAFAAKAGAVADDGDGKNSQYASALVKYIAEPGVDLRLALGRVRDEVLKTTSNRQEPFVYGSLGGDNLSLVPAPQKPVEADPDVRIDYELAAQVGTKEVWDSFLTHHPTGFYANLAKAQINKLATAEQSHASADNARRDAEQQAADKAEKLAKIREVPAGQTAAEKQALLEQSKKELEEARKQAELAQQRAEAARLELEQARRQAVEEAQRQVEEARRLSQENARKTAALTPDQPAQPATAPSSSPMGQADITRLLQAHLKRVGCNSGQADGNWGEGSQEALALFNKSAKTRFDTRIASLEALDAVRGMPERVCPLVCAKGERASGDHCVEIGCARGYFLNSRGTCEKRYEPAPRERAQVARPRLYGPAPALAPPTGGSVVKDCALDASGHRDTGGFRCKNL